MAQKLLYSPEAEAALIGAALVDASIFSSAAIDPDDFYLRDMAAIWRTAHKLIAAGIAPDFVTLPDELEKAGAGLT